jgi:hypothetical protein
MHLNPFHPNILYDMQAATNGHDLCNKRYGIKTAKRHLIPHKSYPYASERQTQRQQANFIIISAKRRYRDFRRYGKAEAATAEGQS